jgi:hypothetical protein
VIVDSVKLRQNHCKHPKLDGIRLLLSRPGKA